jgi:hypothetical protein
MHLFRPAHNPSNIHGLFCRAILFHIAHKSPMNMRRAKLPTIDGVDFLLEENPKITSGAP